MRVVVADDVMLTREGIVRLLRDGGIDVVAEAEDAESLLRHIRLLRPDLALVDIRMPPTHTDEGLVAAQTIRAEHPEVGVLVLSQSTRRSSRASWEDVVGRTTRSLTLPSENERCSGSSLKACPTERSPPVSTSPSAPSRHT